MRFTIPATDLTVRLFEPVETTDTQYDICDLGFEHKNGEIDSVVVGGSFHTLKKTLGQLEEQKTQREADKADAAKFRTQKAESVSSTPAEQETPVEETPVSETAVVS
jgi:hypothetical protein